MRRPLKVRLSPGSLLFLIYTFFKLSFTKQPVSFFSWHGVYSCIALFSTRHTVARRRLVSAAAPAPQSAYLFLSRRSRVPQMRLQEVLAYGPWTSCRSAKWEAGHRTGRTYGSRGVIFDRVRDIFDEVGKNNLLGFCCTSVRSSSVAHAEV